ncbi:cilia- and flagella-associated protein 45 [Drosophila takahashii]|uniref:cilia- and flagella-associated protein 45 n=1 Tax=Drosophila takahashii TaxID=29030 RepID=UPI001CF7FC8D|nr:cilia- and flagella-associated protein 45 [Drosophila takahashii]
MPCFSASNVRFVSAESQLQQKCNELRARARAQTAAYRPPAGGFRPSTTAFGSFRRPPPCDQTAAYDQKQLKRNERERKRNQGTKQVVLRPGEVRRLKDQGKLETVGEKLQRIEQLEEDHRRQLQMVEETRRRFKAIDEARGGGVSEARISLLSEILEEKQSVLGRAFLARQEQEQEVKQINRMILDAKCKAVREAQIQEKHLLSKALREDDERLARMVNERAQKALTEEDERERLEVEKRNRYAQEIRQQLSERENVRYLEAKRVADEAKDIRRATELLRGQEEQQRASVQQRKQRFREELQRIRDMSNVFKTMLSEQERLAELRVTAYMREKQEKERQLKEMQRLAKKEFERRQQRIFTVAAEAMETRQTNDELKYLKERDRVEREYRQREKEAAISRREAERDLLESRAQQAQEMKQRLALEIAHAGEEFAKVMERMRKEEEKEKALDRQRESQRQLYRQDLRQQMTDKQAERRRLAEMEAVRVQKWLEQEKQRDANIRQVISAKIAAMRENCLPEKYLREVEKQLKSIQASRDRIR